MSLQVKCVRGCEGLGRVKQDWVQLHQALEKPGLNHDWRWYDALAKYVFAERLRVCCVYDDAGPVAIFAFLLNKRRFGFIPYRSLELLNHPAYIYTTDALIRPDYANKPLLSLVTRVLGEQEAGNWDICDLEGFGERTHLMGLSEVASASRGGENRSAYIPCKDEQDLAVLSSKYLREIRRFTRRAAEAYGQVSLELEPLDTPDKVFDEFVRIEDAGWKGSEGMQTSIACTGEQGTGFYRHLHKEFGATGDCKIFFLRFGDTRVAAAFALHAGARWYLYKIGYDEKYAKYSPGNIMLKLFIDNMALDPAVVEINLVTCPAWIKPWHMASEALNNLVIYSDSIRARTIRFLRTLRNENAQSAASYSEKA